MAFSTDLDGITGFYYKSSLKNIAFRSDVLLRRAPSFKFLLHWCEPAKGGAKAKAVKGTEGEEVSARRRPVRATGGVCGGGRFRGGALADGVRVRRRAREETKTPLA